MPSEESNNDLDTAFKRYGKRLKKTEADQDPKRDRDLRARVEKIDATIPYNAELTSETERILKVLKDDFEIVVKPPSTPDEFLVHLLARRRIQDPSTWTIAASELYTQLHEIPSFQRISPKTLRKVLTRLEKKKVLQLKESEETLLIRLRSDFLTEDEARLLDIAARKGGVVTMEQAMVSTQWSQARVVTALEALTAKKMLVLKKGYAHGKQYQVTPKE